MKTKIIASTLSIAIVTIMGVTAYMQEPNQDTTPAKSNASVSETEPTDAVTADVEPATDTTAGAAVAATTEPEQPSEPSVPDPRPQPASFNYVAEMDAVGIAQSDYGYVTEMLLDENGWRTSGDNLWRGFNDIDGSLKDRLNYASTWVRTNYGSWAAAYQQYKNTGNF